MDFIFELAALLSFTYCLLFTLKAFGINLSLFNSKPDYRIFLNNEEIIPNKNTKNIYIVHEQIITKTTQEINHPKEKILNKNDLKLSEILSKKTKEKLPNFNTNIFD